MLELQRIGKVLAGIAAVQQRVDWKILINTQKDLELYWVPSIHTHDWWHRVLWLLQELEGLRWPRPMRVLPRCVVARRWWYWPAWTEWVPALPALGHCCCRLPAWAFAATFPSAVCTKRNHGKILAQSSSLSSCHSLITRTVRSAL